VVLRVVFEGGEISLEPWVFVVLKGILLIPGPWFLNKDGVGLAAPG
jgi:hypothetical protein